MKEIDSSTFEQDSDIIHYQKINIFGDSDVGKSSLISLMEKYNDDNFKIEENENPKNNNNFVLNNEQSLIEQIKRVQISINETKDSFFNFYETNLDNYDDIKNNLEILLLQTEGIIIMWDSSKYKTFNNIENFLSIIQKGMQENKFRKVPIFVIENKKDLNANSSQDIEEKNKIKDSIEKIQKGKENSNIEFKEISLLNKDDFLELIIDINRNLNTHKENIINDNDVVNLVKFKVKPIPFSNNKNDIILIKCNFLGASNTGKTTFIKYIQGKENKTYISTVGIESLYFKANINKENAYIQITDTCGQERFHSITKNQLKNVDAILLFYDITNRESFKSLDYWFETINNSVDLKEIACILVANKIDESKNRNVSRKEGLDIAEQKRFKYYECSSLNGLNVYEILNELILEGYYKNCEKRNNQVDLNQSLERSNSHISFNDHNYLKEEKKEGDGCFC